MAREARYDPTDAIFFGFKLIRRDPLLMLALAGLSALVTLVGMQIIWPHQAEFAQSVAAFGEGDGEPDVTVLTSAMAVYFSKPAILGFFAASIVVSLIAQGAVLRGLLFEERSGWVMGLQLGADELRILVVALIAYLLTGLAYAAVGFVGGLVAAVLGLASQAFGVLMVFVVLIAALLAAALVGTRLSLAAPMSVGEQKYVVTGSWGLTRGRMWGLLGAYVILFIILMILLLVVSSLTSILAPRAQGVMQGMIALSSLDDPGAAFRSPGFVLLTALNAGVSMAALAGWAGVGAYAYRTLGPPAGYAGAPALPAPDAGGSGSAGGGS